MNMPEANSEIPVGFGFFFGFVLVCFVGFFFLASISPHKIL